MFNNIYFFNIIYLKMFNDYFVFFSDKGLYELVLIRMMEVFE